MENSFQLETNEPVEKLRLKKFLYPRPESLTFLYLYSVIKLNLSDDCTLAALTPLSLCESRPVAVDF